MISLFIRFEIDVIHHIIIMLKIHQIQWLIVTKLALEHTCILHALIHYKKIKQNKSANLFYFY